MLFIKQEKFTILFLRLSGEVYDKNHINNWKNNREEKIQSLLDGKVSYIPWDNYTSDLQGKEVIVSVASDSGEIIGAIVRGVIEK